MPCLYPQLKILDTKDHQRRRHDAELSAFTAQELLQVKAKMYNRRYPELDAREHIPLDNEIAPGTMQWSYESFDERGQAAWLGAGSNDIPRVDISKKRVTFPIYPFGAGYGWNLLELLAARQAGGSLPDTKAEVARKACATFEHNVLLLGDSHLNVPGFLTNPAVPVCAVPNGDWLNSARTAAELIQDVNYILDRPWLGSNLVHRADTFLAPAAQMRRLETTVLPNTNGTVLSFLKESNPNVREWRILRELATAGVGGGARAMAYEKSPENLEGFVPMPFSQLDPDVRSFNVFVGCWQTCGGTVFYYPMSAIYADGI